MNSPFDKDGIVKIPYADADGINCYGSLVVYVKYEGFYIRTNLKFHVAEANNNYIGLNDQKALLVHNF